VNMVEWPFTQINNGSIISVWEMFPGVPDPPEQQAFEKEFNLMVSSSNNHPYLQWNGALYSINHYEIWKKKDRGSYSLLTTTTDNYYVDNAEFIYTPGAAQKAYAYYKIRAKINNKLHSLFSNEDHIAVNDYPGIEKELPGLAPEHAMCAENQNFSIDQNYPNPFNHETRISFYLAHDENVILKIFDVNAKVIRTLVDNEFKTQGQHNVNFKMDNLPSGLYFYRILAGDFKATTRMIYLK
ncbi:MAG TPA: T9SS type A sorting domain-containing protein, partial [bacterium]|nr:T9SS type A sorting domain-containing protein [bacterium]